MHTHLCTSARVHTHTHTLRLNSASRQRPTRLKGSSVTYTGARQGAWALADTGRIHLHRLEPPALRKAREERGCEDVSVWLKPPRDWVTSLAVTISLMPSRTGDVTPGPPERRPARLATQTQQHICGW